ncbi:hypothetical protein MATL_G00215680 [Megalops atlanticus]|uniref:C2H2-type domain-containing protein n=1 Tax=Megalops atlanticus TaxID=7932 RepID=A0A9D3PIF1_MEGAT|nr:hypothetical protein MATL_G00215680 [Megalops atlanticus]
MSKMERLKASVAQLLAVAVHEVLDVVGQAVSEYQEETARTQRENESLRRRLWELQEVVKTVSTGGPHSLSLAVSEGRSPIEQQHYEQDWNCSLREDTELTVHEEKAELIRHRRTRQRDEELRRLESDHSADSEAECEVLGLSALGSECGTQMSDTAQSIFTCRSVKNDSDVDSVHTVNIPNTLSPNTCNSGTMPSLASDEIKMEPEPPECSMSEQHAAQIPLYGCADALGNLAQDEPNQELYHSERESQGQIYLQPERSTVGKRFKFGKIIRSLSDNKKHKQYKRKEEQHICFLCGKTFSRVANLRIHQRCHTGEKPYCCVQCGRCFSQAGDLKKHKRVHTGEKPYHCIQCGKSFSRGENLKRHQKTHVGDPLLV